MLPVMHGDVMIASRALLAVPKAQRVHLAQRIICEAKAANQYRLSTGRAHPVWGNGSVMSAASRFERARDPGLDNTEYCTCLIMILECLMQRQSV